MTYKSYTYNKLSEELVRDGVFSGGVAHSYLLHRRSQTVLYLQRKTKPARYIIQKCKNSQQVSVEGESSGWEWVRGWGSCREALHVIRLLVGDRLVQQQVGHVRVAQVVRVGRRDGRSLVVGRWWVLVLVQVLVHGGRVGAQVGARRGEELPARQQTGHGLRRVQQAGRRRCGRRVAAQHWAARGAARLAPLERMVL